MFAFQIARNAISKTPEVSRTCPVVYTEINIRLVYSVSNVNVNLLSPFVVCATKSFRTNARSFFAIFETTEAKAMPTKKNVRENLNVLNAMIMHDYCMIGAF
jgi:hypothetical protein